MKSPQPPLQASSPFAEHDMPQGGGASGVSFRRLLCATLGLVLLAAAALKSHHLLTNLVPNRVFLLSRPVQLLTVESELALGLWLLSGFYLRWAGRAAVVYFVALAVASAYLLTAGVDCCGCLGRLPVNIWFTFTFNIAAVCSLLLCPPDNRPTTEFSTRPNLAIGLLGVFVFAGLYVLVAGTEKTVASSVDIGEEGALVVLDVENWQSKRLPILDQINIASDLGDGRWMIIFYHDGCAECE